MGNFVRAVARKKLWPRQCPWLNSFPMYLGLHARIMTDARASVWLRPCLSVKPRMSPKNSVRYALPRPGAPPPGLCKSCLVFKLCDPNCPRTWFTEKQNKDLFLQKSYFSKIHCIRSIIGSADSSNILQIAGNGYFIADKFHLEDSLLSWVKNERPWSKAIINARRETDPDGN